MEFKVFIQLILYILLYLFTVSALKKTEIDEQLLSQLKKGFIYILVLIFGWNLIIDTVLVLQDFIPMAIKIAVGAFFTVFYTLEVYWQYKSRSGL